MKNVLVLSGAASAINYINSYACDGSIRLHVTDSDPYCPGLYSRGVFPHWFPRARDILPYRAALDDLVSREAIDVLIPTSDRDVEAVVAYLNDGWSPSIALFRPPPAAHRCLANKHRLMTRLAEALPHLVPRTWSRNDAGDVGEFPVVVKPTAEGGGKGVGIVHRPEDLPAAMARTTFLFGKDLIVQQFIPGRTYVTSLVYDQQGSLVVSVSMRSLLTFFTWGGGGCAGEIVDDDGLTGLGARVIDACGGWCGPINLEWRRHETTGRFFLLEANCRLNGYSYLTTMNGVCLPKIVLSLLMGTRPPPIELPPLSRRHNFVIGFREQNVERWVAGPGSM